MRTRTLALTAGTSALCGAALLGPSALPATADVPGWDAPPQTRVGLVPDARSGSWVGPVPDARSGSWVGPVPDARSGSWVGPVPDARPGTRVTPGPVTAPGTREAPVPGAAADAPVTAEELLAEVRSCRQVSRGRYRTDANRSKATVPVCATADAVFWKADMDIDCDGRRTKACNTRTDPHFQPQTAFPTSRGKPLNSAALPFVVVPAPGRLWDYRKSGLTGGSVVAVVHRDRVRYAVIGDTGPAGIIGEGSYALAKELSIDPHPTTGGAASGVTYIAFKDSRVSPIESRAKAGRRGEALARAFVGRE
ncbi:glycoside hydrolase family 75 protein [Streptomyces sp. NPDC088755]|uniref:glycoside hydrolase family 75 protein n=1 Tax=Streptomyces sp. NPDC088755 TaxID=3365888 RepID=UPI00380C74F6